jgi:pimeloyl-ACP methyl ester carboxylesterase
MELPDNFKRHSLKLPWGCCAWYERRGDGPTVLCLHGSGCDSTDWVPLIGHLPCDYRLLLMDFRGHGRSDNPPAHFTISDLTQDAAALLDEAGAQGVVAAGHSLGGMVAMELSGARPELVGALALLEGWPSIDAIPEGWDKAPTRLPGAERERINARTRKTIARVGARNWLEFWKSLEEFDGRPVLEQHRIRVIAVWGDRAQPRPSYEDLGMPPSLAIQHLWIEGAGHYLPLEHPHTAAHAVLRLARGLRR